MAANNGNQEAPDKKQEYLERLRAFEQKINNFNVADLPNYVINDLSSPNNGKNSFVLDCIKEFRELTALNKDENGQYIDEETQLRVYNVAAEKLGSDFWLNFQTTEKVVNDTLKKVRDLAAAHADESQIITALYGTMSAIKRCPENNQFVAAFDQLYSTIEEQYGASALRGVDHETGYRADERERSEEARIARGEQNFKRSFPKELRFRVQMRVWERMVNELEAKNGDYAENDQDRLVQQSDQVRKLAKGDNGQPFDKDRYMAAFERSALMFGEPIWTRANGIPMSIPEKHLREFREQLEAFNNGARSPEDEDNLARSFRTAVGAAYRGQQKPSEEVKNQLKGYYLTIKENCRPEAVDKIYVEVGFDKIFPEFAAETKAGRERLKQLGDLSQARADARSKILNALSGTGGTVLQIQSLIAADDANPKHAAFVGLDEDILENMQEDMQKLDQCYRSERSVIGLEKSLKNIHDQYPKYINKIQGKIQKFQPGSFAYKNSIEALSLCGAMLIGSQQYVKNRLESNLIPGEQIPVRDATDCLKQTLSVFKEAFQAFPRRGSTRIFADLKDSIDKVINGEGTLQDVLDKAQAYYGARKGTYFGPVTDLGKHRLFVADKLIDFLGHLDVAGLDKEMAAKAIENVQENVQENAVPVVPAQSQETPGGDVIDGNVVDEENLINNGSDEYVKIEENVEENLIDNGSKNAPEQENAKVEKQEEVKSNAVMSMDDKVYELIREKCKQLKEDGVVPKGSAGDIAIIAYNASYEQKEFLLNNILKNDNKVKALVADHPESKDFQKALNTILDKVNNPVEQNEVGVAEKQVEHSIENQSEMKQNEFNLLEPDDENEFHLLDPEDGPENNEMQQSGYGI